MIYLEDRHQNILQNILKKYPYTFYAFGSRAKGTQRKLSDLDLCFIEPIPLSVQAHIEEDFEESDLPFTVDLVNWNRADEAFKRLVYPDLVLLQRGQNNIVLPEQIG
ncbi:MAG TPA: nucleotidyltransferase domain-containing protein [Candidatus Babeliales bacterium]|jgi:predicted nucleotidyltransferase|nr:nucleotidyltransferase domain-containing protein [Candidatus Babeliales bacterium]